MLVTRQNAPEQNHWSITKFETTFNKSSDSLRMSNNFDTPLSTQSDWQGQYSFLPPGDNGIFSHSYDHVTSSTDNNDSQAQPRSAAASGNPLDIDAPKSESGSLGSPLGHRLDPLGLRQPKQQSPIREQPEVQGEQYAQKAAESVHEESLVSAETPGMPLGSNSLGSVSSATQGQDMTPGHPGNEVPGMVKEEDDEILDDEEMIEGDGERDAPSQPQTAAERTAQRRKMKRFRLTHQQTRFLMSEFAKQPHPDAAHRERLSREIPGLSPRQVQVWFQNRRAKIKRLTADDRDRMLKMRAVPDDFDNVQALHSPYGAVHGLGTPMQSPVDFGNSPYGDHMMRPLMVDVRRPEGDDHLSPTGLSPAFGSIGFNPSGTISNPDILSPMSPNSNERYGYPSHLSPMNAGPRTSNPFGRNPSMDNTGMQMPSHHQQRQHIRPLQPLQLRETMSRSRSDTLQSPLRSSMSWKGDSIDYTTYHGGGGSPPMSGRQPSIYPNDQMNSTSTSGIGGYDSSNYSGSAVQSPTGMNYSSFNSPSLQPNNQNRSRLRAASASLPLGLDLRTQFRSVGSPQNMQPSSHSPGPRTTSTPQQLNNVSSGGYTASFPSAPLTAPMDFSLPRTPGFRSSAADYSMPQMSAPIAPPNDFSQAFQASMTSTPTGSSRTPMRDTFSGSAAGPLGMGSTGSSGATGTVHSGSETRNDDYSQDPLGMKRKPSFTGHSQASGTGTGTYSTAT